MSGCKVNPEYLPLFIQNLKNQSFETLIINGLDFNELPVNWPQVSDRVFLNFEYFAYLLNELNSKTTIRDLRIGFLFINQILQISNEDLVLSLYNFGLTGDCWVYRNKVFEAPSRVLKWRADIIPEDMVMCYKSSVFNGDPIDSIDFASCRMNDSALISILCGLSSKDIRDIDFSDNILTDLCIPSLCRFVSSTRFNSLSLGGVYFSETNLITLLDSLRDDSVVNLSIAFATTDDGVRAHHQLFDVIASKLHLFSGLTIDGSITAMDAITITRAIRNNDTLKRLELKSKLAARYKKGQIDDSLQADFEEFSSVFRDAMDAGVSVLEEFKFGLFTEFYVFREAIIANIDPYRDIILR